MSRKLEDIIPRIKELNPNIYIRKATPGDSGKFVELFNRYYKRKTTSHYFNWQFYQSPYSSAMFMAFEAEKLVGFYGVKKLELSNGSFTGFAIDFLIDYEFRKRGIGFLLEMEVNQFCLENGIKVLTALPNNFGNAALKVLGWKSISKVNSMVFELTEMKLSNLVDVEVENMAYDFTERISFVKNLEYREWRYIRNPFYSYTKLELENESFAVVKLFKDVNDQRAFLDVVEMVHLGSAENIENLIKKVFQLAEELEVHEITIWALSKTLLNSVVQKIGFRKKEQERYFCIKELEESSSTYSSIANWDLSEIDAEIF